MTVRELIEELQPHAENINNIELTVIHGSGKTRLYVIEEYGTVELVFESDRVREEDEGYYSDF